MNRFINAGAKASLILLSASVLYSCGNDSSDPGLEYAPDMYNSVGYEPLTQLDGDKNVLNPGGLNMRVPAANTIARGNLGFYSHLSKDSAEIAGVELQNPLETNSLNLNEGKVLYLRFCSPCHGAEGAGDGLVGEKFKGVPNFGQGRYAALPGGHIYHVITNGRGRMMPHGTQVNPEERWKIAMYVQQLQKGIVDVEEEPATESMASAATSSAAASAGTDQKVNPVTGTGTNLTKDTRN